MFTRCLWLYLALVVCSIWNFLFYIYILVKTDYGFNYFTIYIIFLLALLLFTGIYGFLRCLWRDFSGYILKILTLSAPIITLIEIIVYFASSIYLKGFWIKFIIDIITIIVGVILILYLYGLINTKNIKYDEDTDIKEGLLNSEKKEESPIYSF